MYYKGMKMSKILLVDDDIELTDLLAEVLRLTGFEVEVANNGQEALDKLNASHQLVLLDIMMPVLNGIETLKKIRQTSNVPVMMLTARGEEIDRVLGLELGAMTIYQNHLTIVNWLLVLKPFYVVLHQQKKKIHKIRPHFHQKKIH